MKQRRYVIAPFGDKWFVRDTVTGRGVEDDVLGYIEMTSRLDAEFKARRMNAKDQQAEDREGRR